MMVEDLGIVESDEPPLRNALLTTATLSTLGALKVKSTNRNWLVSGLEMMLVGGLAAAAAYGIGVLLSGLA